MIISCYDRQQLPGRVYLSARIRMLLVEGCLAGTGSREGDHITRVCVSPAFQGKGYGTYIIKKLEEQSDSGKIEIFAADVRDEALIKRLTQVWRKSLIR